MEKITTYYATRRNILVWLAALLCICAAVARIIFAGAYGIDGKLAASRIILFVAANLIIAIRLPLRGEKQFYVTVIPVIILTMCLCLDAIQVTTGFSTAVIGTLSILFALVYFITFSGNLKTKYVSLAVLLGTVGIIWFATDLESLITFHDAGKWMTLSVFGTGLGVLFVILSAGKLPPYKEGDPYRLRFGDRLDGRRVRNMPVMSKVTPYFMPTRIGRSNYIDDTVEVSNMERYITRKRKEGLNHFGITHVIVASYIRTVSEMPELNRFVAGQRVYHRFDTSVNMVVKKEMTKDSPDSSIKVYFDPKDTAKDVYEKFNTAMEKAREDGIANSYDAATHILDYLPGIVMSAFGVLVRIMDYFGILPFFLERVSPFHGSLFITSMGSLGIPPVFHHLYDFGTVPVFCAFGHKYTKHELNKNGEQVVRKYIDYKVVCDEGICDGFYYAAAFKKLRSYLAHPERLDLPPEEVKEDIY